MNAAGSDEARKVECVEVLLRLNNVLVPVVLYEESLVALADALAHYLERNEPSPWLTAEKAAERLGWPVKRIRNLTVTGEIPHHRVGRRVLYDRTELDEWLRTQ
jgi:excisionase family DNA binding protein